jgi:hypothetical protein
MHERVKCPGCGAVQKRRKAGPWARRLLRLLRMRPFKCGVCRHRFDDPNPLVSWSSSFLSPVDNRVFEDFVRDIARDERENREREQEGTVRRPEDWPAVGGAHRNHPRR